MIQEIATPPRGRGSTNRVTLRRMLWLVAGFLALASVLAGSLIWFVAGSYFRTGTLAYSEAFPAADNRPAPITRPAGATNMPVNLLLLGSDGEPTESGQDLTSRGSRSDTIILINIPADRDTINFMSIMRDNWVPIPGHGTSKINAALSHGGPALAVQTVESIFQTPIDHVVLVDFDGVRDVTEALGGVTVDNPATFSFYGHVVPQGEVTLTGEEALHFVRNRDFPDGDYTRVENQQMYLTELARKLLSSETLASPLKVRAALDSFAPYVTLDEGLGLPTALGLGVSLRDIRTENIDMFTSPTLGVGTEGVESVVYPDWGELTEISRHLQEDTLSSYSPGD